MGLYLTSFGGGMETTFWKKWDPPLDFQKELRDSFPRAVAITANCSPLYEKRQSQRVSLSLCCVYQKRELGN
jgi:hypothetical protein